MGRGGREGQSNGRADGPRRRLLLGGVEVAGEMVSYRVVRRNTS